MSFLSPSWLTGRLVLEPGIPRDYFRLHAFHYLPKRPRTFAQVWRVRYVEEERAGGTTNPPAPISSSPLRVARELARGSPVGDTPRNFEVAPVMDPTAHLGRTTGVSARSSVKRVGERAAHEEIREQARGLHEEGEVGASRLVAVAVLSWPFVRCAMRERHFQLKGLTIREKLAFANAHVRTISRVVVHPQFRSLGLARALVECICANCPTRYVEASARMAEFHPMFERGGMTRIPTRDPTLPAYFLFDRQALLRTEKGLKRTSFGRVFLPEATNKVIDLQQKEQAMARIPGTTDNQTEFLRKLKAGELKDEDFPSAFVFRKWLKRESFRRIFESVISAMWTMAQFRLMTAAPNLASSLAARVAGGLESDDKNVIAMYLNVMKVMAGNIGRIATPQVDSSLPRLIHPDVPSTEAKELLNQIVVENVPDQASTESK